MNISTPITVALSLFVGAGIGIAAYLGGFPPFDSDDILQFREEQEVVEEQGFTTQLREDLTDPPADPEQIAEFERIEKFLEKNAHHKEKAKAYGAALVDAGQFRRAETMLAKQLEAYPEEADYWYALGWTYENAKHWPQAIDAYEKAIQFQEDHVGAINNLAWVLATSADEKARDGKRAVEYAEKALELAGDRSLFAADTMAAAYAELGDFKYAAEVQQWVVENSPPSKLEDNRERLELYKKGQAFRVK